MVGLLVAHRADRSATDAKDMTALDYAKKRKFNQEILKLLLL